MDSSSSASAKSSTSSLPFSKALELAFSTEVEVASSVASGITAASEVTGDTNAAASPVEGTASVGAF